MPQARSVIFEAELPALPLKRAESAPPEREAPEDALRAQLARVREELDKLEAML